MGNKRQAQKNQVARDEVKKSQDKRLVMHGGKLKRRAKKVTQEKKSTAHKAWVVHSPPDTRSTGKGSRPRVELEAAHDEVG